MEAYPDDYITHNLPLVVLSGLENASATTPSSSPDGFDFGRGTRITSDLPCLSGSRAEHLLSEFMKADGSALPWNVEGHGNRPDLIGFKLASSGREYTFPLRKAAPPPLTPSLSPPNSPQANPSPGIELHSPLSPLSPSSALFPDGVLSPHWVAKHQHHVPSVFISFFEINADPSSSSLQDNHLKNDINAIKTALTKSGFKTRYAVVLLSDKSLSAAPELEERLAALRRATSLDSKTSLFFLPPNGSRTELASFVTNVLVALQPVCIEYYRDLTKHARRKKNRGYVPPPTAAPTRGTSQTLSTQGWNVRYEFKQGVFAEFRQEMDVAERHYSFAIEELFNPEGVFETTPSWSPRWDEARLLCDVIALRVLRCQLWRGMTTGAAESWSNYKERMQDLVDRRGKGTATYGWEAWEARWARIMAELIEMADLPVFQTSDIQGDEESGEAPVSGNYAPPEKAFSAMERLPPFHFLHHPGYFYSISAKYNRARRKRAEAMPEEDRTPPGQSPASQVAHRTRTYDTYLVPQPHEEMPLPGQQGFNYLSEIKASIEQAERHFRKRGQTRAAAHLMLRLAKDFVDGQRFQDALDVLRPTWDNMVWRREQWWDLAATLLQLVHICAVKREDRSLRMEVEWEMALFPKGLWRPVDLTKTIRDYGSSSQTVTRTSSSSARLSPVSLSFSFGKGAAHVGESASAQLVLSSNAAKDTTPITLSGLTVEFNGNPARLEISHSTNSDGRSDTALTSFEHVELADEGSSSLPGAKIMTGSTNLTLRAGQRRIFALTIPLRDADPLKATEASISLESGNVHFQFAYVQPADIQSNKWWLPSDKQPFSQRIGREQSNMINVLPKPPKMQIRVRNLSNEYFTNETTTLELEFSHEEDDEAEATLKIRTSESTESSLRLAWEDDRGAAEVSEGDAVDVSDSTLESLKLGRIGAESQIRRLRMTAPDLPSNFTISVEVAYHLLSDTDTAMTKTLTLNLTFVSPFEANYEFKPRVHPDRWPSFFSLPDPLPAQKLQEPEGIVQRWCLTSRIASFASEPLIIEQANILINNITNNAICSIDESSEKPTLRTTIPQAIESVPFILTTRKLTLEDRRSSTLDVSLSITWRRQSASTDRTFTTLLAVPNLTVPASEPRVLCSATRASSSTSANDSADPELVHLTYTLENPSMHYLTFTLTMEASDAFAFSGPKYRTLSLTPMSRTSVKYTLLVHEGDRSEDVEEEGRGKGRWVWPVLRVVDAYFQKNLRVLEAGEEAKGDGRGGVGVWVPRK